MKRTIAALVPLLMAGAMTLALAQTSDQTANITTGFAGTSCLNWTQARANHQSAFMEYFALGFVSGANVARYWDDKIDIMKGTYEAALFGWIDNYCRSNPLESFPHAAAHLVIDLKARAQHQ
jgi:hypothetical protein